MKGDGKKNIVSSAIQYGNDSTSKKDTKPAKCHTMFTSIENVQDLLLDDLGRFIPTEDVCKVCRQPFTMEQKVGLLNAAMEKQRESNLGFNPKKKNIVVENSSQG